jgi:putative SOS response-associated peptidase YedK
MCGRYILITPAEALRRLLEALGSPNLPPRWIVAPTQDAPVARLGVDGKRHLAMLRWGLVPGWAKDLALGAKAINARADTVADKPSFREAFRRRRCLVPADGYYEWMVTGKTRQPYVFKLRDGEPMVFAGLWERWRSPAGETVESFGFVTTDASADVTPVHDRMPVILEPAAWAAWLDPATPPAALQALLVPLSAGRLDHHPVSQRVNSARSEGPECAEPSQPEAPRLL